MPSTASMSSNRSTLQSIQSSLEKLILHEDDTANDATVNEFNFHNEENLSQISATKLCGVTHKKYEFHYYYYLF